jgi:hypothetical protein
VANRVLIAAPGPSFPFAVSAALFTHATDGRNETFVGDNPSSAWDGFNALWLEALNSGDRFTHFAMLHADVVPEGFWVDTLIGELERTGVDLISTVIPIKDRRGLTTTGIGDSADPWGAWRRFTVRECLTFPETFNAADTGYPGKCLLHNHGCIVADLRRPVFQTTNPDGSLKVAFAFPRRAVKVKGNWVVQAESEDWYFSRMLHEAGGRSVATRKVRVRHLGGMEFTNFDPWGMYEHGDEDTAAKWRPKPVTQGALA